jgi:DNA processing protein
MTQEANPRPDGCTSTLSPEHLGDWLRLIMTPGLGAVSQHRLLNTFQHASQILAAIDNGTVELPAKARKGFAQTHHKMVDRCLAWQAKKDRRQIICWSDARYPALLKEIPDPPPLLFVEGETSALSQPQLAIVGSRKATPSGLETTRQFASALSQHGLGVTSGLALGIDASAHIGCLDAQGITTAVLGNGLDKIYPARHQSLADEIIEKGVLVSEFPPGTPPLAQNFPRRNRIISGLSLGVLVVEAAVRSGSLITARLAGEQGREVFAIPGSIHNPLARGAHRLLRDGATLVEQIDDILNELGPLAALVGTAAATSAQKSVRPAIGAEQQFLLDCMGFDPVDTDTLVARSQLTTERVSSMLLLLELQGNIAALGGGHFQRRV